MDKKKIKSFIEINIGVLAISIGYYFFLLPTNLVTGGIMGLSILIKDFIPFPPSIFLYICAIILLILSGITLGKNVFLKSVYGALLQPTFIFILEHIVPADYLINTLENPSNALFVATVFSVIIYAGGIGILFKNDTTIGGMDTVQKIMNKYTKLPLSVCMYITDGLVIFFGLFLFGIEKGAFALVTMFLTGKVVDYVCIGSKNKKTVQIITTKSDEIKNYIYNTINRGVTEIDAQGGYSLEPKKILLCVLTNQEYLKIKEGIYNIDHYAFIVITDANEVLGKGFTLDKYLK